MAPHDDTSHDEEVEQEDWYAEARLAQYDDDPNPYHGDYSEE